MGQILRGLSVFIGLLLALKGYSQDVKIRGLTYQRYEGETLVWKLISQEFYKEGEERFLAQRVYLENIPKGIKIFADSAQYQVKEEKFLLRGRVRLITEKEGEVYTEELIFFPKKDFLEAPGRVLIRKDRFEITGEGLSYDVSQGDFKLHKKARAQFHL